MAMCSQGGSSSRRQRGPMTDGSGLKPLGLQSSFKPLPESSISSAFELFNKFNTAFVAFDLDGDGTITASELATATRSLGQQVSDDEMANLISQFDLNDNGAIDFDEFCELMTRQAGGGPIEAVREAARQVVEAEVEALASPPPPSQQRQAPRRGLERRWWGGESTGGPALHTA